MDNKKNRSDINREFAITGLIKVAIAATIILLMAWGWTALVQTAYSEQVPDFEANEAGRTSDLRSAFVQFYIDARKVYCDPRIDDLDKKIEIKAKLGEDTAELSASRDLLESDQGCLDTIQEILF